ncbi:hypothetical protein [Rubinisphaera margarita]|uniref:hypothetical protein n=1 Tax=Rubinisphaera margarita TaxID=2909586 RepID=UPI001EE8120D|nr:hypothetical protein [Rubinisphaera margarita]MCG6155696.1 hypothetical protein [Rubinisphaera margarita]
MTKRTAQAEKLFCCMLLLCACVLPGCGTSSWGVRSQWTSMLHRSSKIAPEATKDQIVTQVNESLVPIHAWRATSAQVNVSGILVPLKAMVAVEEPNHLRLTVSSGLAGPELDLGSNNSGIWFWMRQAEPKAILSVSHENLTAVQRDFPVPVQPEWLMEVLCVKPIDASKAELVRNPDQPYTVKLVSHHTNESGVTVRKISTIDLRKAEVTGHELYDAEHRLIASAELSNYKEFPNTTARLPHKISLRWEQQDMQMTLSLNGVEINPPHMPSAIWDIPQMAEYPVHELGPKQLLPSDSIAKRSLRDKPKAITEYELDEPSGAWMQNQTIKMPQEASTAAGNQVEPAGHASVSAPFTAHEMPAAQPTDKRERPSPFFQPDDELPTPRPAEPEVDDDTPVWARPRPETTQQPERKSRDELIIQ